MPIDLTTVGDGTGSPRHRRRRRSNRNNVRWHLRLAIGGGFLALGLLAGILIYTHHDSGGRSPVSNSNYDSGFTPKPPTPVEEAVAPPEVASAPATSSGELPDSQAMAKLVSLARVRGADATDALKIEYEFYKAAKSPSSYLFLIRLPGSGGVKYASFGNNAARKDTVILPITLSQIGSRGPISVYIVNIIPSDERVSNILTIP